MITVEDRFEGLHKCDSLFCFFSLVTTIMLKAGGTRLATAIPLDAPV
jgi:hypothetical protein